MNLAVAAGCRGPPHHCGACQRSALQGAHADRLVLDGTGRHLARLLHGAGAFVAGASLGVSLERLVDLLSGPNVTLREELLPQAAFAVRFVKDERFPLAEVRFDDVVVERHPEP